LEESTVRRARNAVIGAFHTIRFWTTEITIGVGLTIWTQLWQPGWADKDAAMTWYQGLVPFAGVAAGFGFLFLLHLALSPYAQRDEARKRLRDLESGISPVIPTLMAGPMGPPGPAGPAGESAPSLLTSRAHITFSDGLPEFTKSTNVSAVTDGAELGLIDVVWNEDYADSEYDVSVTPIGGQGEVVSISPGGLTIQTLSRDGLPTESMLIRVLAVGDSATTPSTLDNVIHKQSNGDDVAVAMAALQTKTVSRADRQQETLLRLFSGLANDLTEGITRWTLPYTINELLGYDRVDVQLASGVTDREYLIDHDSQQPVYSLHRRFDSENEKVHYIISEMMLANVVEKRHRPGLPDGETMEDMPADIYLITDLGRRVIVQQRGFDKVSSQNQ